MDSVLTTSGINQLISQYSYSEFLRQISPLETRKLKYTNLSSAWGTLSSKLGGLKSVLATLKESGTSSLFSTARTALSSNEDFITVSAGSSAAISSYSLRVNQLAKSDLLVSDSLTSATARTGLAGTHVFQVGSGDNTTNVSVELTDTETNQTLMEKISAAINADVAEVTSASVDGSTQFTGTGEFVINVNGTETTISYDYTNVNYSDVIDDLVSKIESDVDGVTAEKITSGSNVSLQITAENSSHYITIDRSNDTGGLLDAGNLNMDFENVIGASGFVSSSVFSPTTGTSKFSLTALNSGYDNRLILSDVTGSALSSIGLTSAILSSRTIAPDDDSAGYIYTANSVTDNELNAVLKFNGISIYRNSNIISDLVNDVTFTVHDVMETGDPDVSVTVSRDVERIKQEINNFVTKFNDVYAYIKNQSYSDGSGRGIFLGNASASSITYNLTNVVTNQIPGLSTEDINLLAEIGISFSTQSGLTVDDADLTEALNENIEEVEALFNTENGIAATLYEIVNPYLGADGLIEELQSSYDQNATYISDKIERIQTRIDRSAASLRKRYEGLQQQLVNLLNAQNIFNQLSGGMF